MSEEIINTIDILAQKYGTTAEGLIREMTMKQIGISIISIVFEIIGIVLTILIGLWISKKIKIKEELVEKLYNEFDFFLLFIIFIVLFIIAVCYCSFDIPKNISTLYSWIVAPRIMAIERIMSMVK